MLLEYKSNVQGRVRPCGNAIKLRKKQMGT
jgi:hypothetical protein